MSYMEMNYACTKCGEEHGFIQTIIEWTKQEEEENCPQDERVIENIVKYLNSQGYILRLLRKAS